MKPTFNLEEILNVAETAAEEASRILEEGWKSSYNKLNIEHKGSVDLVTKYDKASENVVISTIKKLRPNDEILAEERDGNKYDNKNHPALWCIDPLDGTTNFSHKFPFFGVSIAFMSEGEALVGVFYAPAMKMKFSAIKGKGANLNGKKLISPQNTYKLTNALVSMGCGYDRVRNPQRYVPLFELLMTHTQGVRRAGSAAFDCCMCAMGWYDAYTEVNLHPWDLAAAELIATEAGLFSSDVDGSGFDAFKGRIVLAKSNLHSQLMNLYNENNIFTEELSGEFK